MPKSNKDSKSMNATNTQVDPIKELRTLIEEKFGNLEQQITLVENKISSQYDNIRNSISAVKKSAIQAIKLGETNSSLISENTEMITLHSFNIDSLNKRIVDLENHLKILQDDLDDTIETEAWAEEEDPHFSKH